ncbi:MAG: PIN domain-containing protein [Candidatus Hadarchaeota archaeon]|nr:PIN domain-containing protein [Candidatus Hadarchaeota archaeon]
MKLCLGSDVFIEALRDANSPSAKLIRKIRDKRMSAFVSFVSVAGLYVGAFLTKRVSDVDALLGGLGRLKMNDPTAKKAGEVRASTGLPLPDCLIGANAILSDVCLVTKNLRHFSKIDGLKVKTPRSFL